MNESRLRDWLREADARQLYRRRCVLESAQGARVRVDGREQVNFCSNDYLGLAADSRVVAAFKVGADRYGSGSGSAHLICGHSKAHHDLEERLADFTGRERALLFSTGYMANVGVISALVGRGDAVFEDRLNHASLLDGGLLSGARFHRYGHGDVEDLQARLGRSPADSKLVVSDGIFSMDGDFAPLPDICKEAVAAAAWVMVDDAHGIGVIGPGGRGTLAHYGLTQAQVPVLVGTLGKALGTFGAFVAGSEVLIEYLIQRARSYIYTTALPPAVAAATSASLEIAGAEEWRRDRLRALVSRFRTAAAQLDLPLMESQTPIQPLMVGDSGRAAAMSTALLQAGFWVTAIRPPTVSPGHARLRITLCAEHREEEVDRLLEALSCLRPGGAPEADHD